MKLRNLYGRFSWLLVALILYLLLYPYFADEGGGAIAFFALSVMLPIAAVSAASGTGRHLAVALVLAMPILIDVLTPIQLPSILPGLLAIAFYSFVLYIVLAAVMSARRVSANTIYGAVCGYLLIGLTASIVFAALEGLLPGAFTVNEANNPSGGSLTWPDFIHYSFVTLTTLGYGEITPVDPIARSFSFLLATAGVMYVAIIVARLVSAYLAEARDGR